VNAATSRTKEIHVNRPMTFCAVLAICIAAFLIPRAALAQSATSVAGAGSGVFPAGAVWQGIPLSGLRFGTGVSLGAITKSATGSPTLALTLNSQPLPVAAVTRGGVGIK
jgi:hypothetical protein